MKQVAASLLLMVITTACYCQQSSSNTSLTAEYYKKKAKNQKVAAAVLGVTGIVLVTGTTIYAVNHLFQENKNLQVPLVIGSVFIAGSIPLIIISDRNYKKAKKLSTSFILQPTPPLIAAIKSTAYYPSITININL